MLEIVLINKYWSRYHDSEIAIDFIGYIDFEGSVINEADDLALFFCKLKITTTNLQGLLYSNLLPKANGNFAFIVKTKNRCILVCDYSRNYPLFIINDDQRIILTDHIGEIPFKKVTDTLAIEEFLLSGFVTGNRTVFQNVKGIQAGEMAIINDQDIQFQRYFVMKPDPFRINSQRTKETIYKEMDSLLISAFKRMICSCPEVNNWIVPLSGGHDSRLIINYLYKLKCKNVICFTYGRDPLSKEVIISKQVADAVGYKWYFIEYTAEEWHKVHTNRLFDKYITYSFNGCSLAHPLDFLAVYKLKELGIINDNDVFVPGLTAFTETSSEAIKDLSDVEQSLKYVYNKYYTPFNYKNQYSKFESNLRMLFENGEQNKYSFPEFFFWNERGVKYLSNWVRVYEFFGLQWRLPLKEKSLIDFWQRIDFDERIERAILFSACKNYLFCDVLKNIPIINKFNKTRLTKKNFRKIIPRKLISMLARVINRKPFVPTGNNLVFANKAPSVKKLVGPLNIYPTNIIKNINSILPRKPYQVNVDSLMAIYTLRNEVFSNYTIKSNNKKFILPDRDSSV